MSMKTNLIALGVLAALALTAVLYKPATSTIQKDLSQGFAAFKSADLSQIERITVTKAQKAEEKDKVEGKEAEKGKEKEGAGEKSKGPSVLELKRSGGDEWSSPAPGATPRTRRRSRSSSTRSRRW